MIVNSASTRSIPLYLYYMCVGRAFGSMMVMAVLGTLLSLGVSVRFRIGWASATAHALQQPLHPPPPCPPAMHVLS